MHLSHKETHNCLKEEENKLQLTYVNQTDGVLSYSYSERRDQTYDFCMC